MKLPLVWVKLSLGAIDVNLQCVPDKPVREDVIASANPNTWELTVDRGVTSYPIFQDLAEKWNHRKLSTEANTHHLYTPAVDQLFLRLTKNYWCPVRKLVIGYKVDRKCWLGSFTLSDCRGVMNQAQETMTMSMRIASDEIRFVRDESWPEIEESQIQSSLKKNLHVEIEEYHHADPDGFQLHSSRMEQPMH